MRNRNEDDATQTIEVLARVEVLAREAGMLPEFVQTGKSSQPAEHNPKHWLYRAICLRMTWNEHTLVTKDAFNAAVAAVSETPLR